MSARISKIKITNPRHALVRRLASSPRLLSRCAIGIPLRPYQQEVADAVLHSILAHLGLSFVVIFPRQSSKNETQAHIQAYLLCLLSSQEIEIVSVSPTLKPQGLNAIRRLQRCLDRNPLTSGHWKSQDGFIVRLDKAFVHFFSGSTLAQTVGATASALLSVDEAQDIRPSTYDRKFAPMAAANRATRVFWGTPWTSSTLLSREQRRAQADQDRDGLRRVWTLTAEDVSLVHPIYGEFVSGEILHYGRTHPYIRTQYFSEEIDAQASMFNPSRIALVFHSISPSPNGNHLGREGVGPNLEEGKDTGMSLPPESFPASSTPIAQGEAASSRLRQPQRHESQGSSILATQLNCVDHPDSVAFLLDLAGQDESRMDYSSAETPLDNPARDSASLSIVGIDLSTLATLQAPTYRILYRRQWIGCNHLVLFGQLKALVERWCPQHIVVDSTGVGEGLYAMLHRSFHSRVIPVKFNLQVKSELGWKFLSVIDTGRFRDVSEDNSSAFPGAPLQFSITGAEPSAELVRLQYVSCLSEILPGPAKTLRWGVPEAARGPDGQLIHDDILLADSLVAALDSLKWSLSLEPVICGGFDPISRCDRDFSRDYSDY